MKISFNRRRIETVCIAISFLLVVLITFLGIVAMADSIFNWDILPPNIENIMSLFMIAIAMVIGASFLISLMINFSLISLSLERFADNFEKHVNNEK